MTYASSYGPDTPYSHVVGLIEAHHNPDGQVVVDLGCGYGAIAEPVRGLSLDYLGMDADPEGLDDLQGRGFQTIVADLRSPHDAIEKVEAALGGRKVAAICMIDVVEHLTDTDAVLQAVRDLAEHHGGAPLVVSIPNVAHVDLAVKLLMGRWDVTRTGLLDSTHVRFFSEHRLQATMQLLGWEEVARDDFELVWSDQHFPADAVALDRGTPIGALLTELSESRANAYINQFVRAYRPTHEPLSHTEDGEQTRPFLSVLVRTRGDRPATLQETLLSLAGQTCDDFEVVLLAHDVEPEELRRITATVEEFHPSFSQRVRVVPVTGGGRARPLNEGARVALGSYVATLDDDDLAFGHWVAEIRAAATRKPRHVARIGTAVQEVVRRPGLWAGQDGYEVRSKPRCRLQPESDQLRDLYETEPPNSGYAAPRSVIIDMGQGWDESLPLLEHWDHYLRSAELCGVESCPTFGALLRDWVDAGRSLARHTPAEHTEALAAVVAKIDGSPLLLDRGSMTRVRELVYQRQVLTGQLREVHAALGGANQALEEARHGLDDVYRSRSWRMTAAFRRLTGGLRRTLRRSGR